MTEQVADIEIAEFQEKHRQKVIELWHKCGLTRPWNDPDKDIDRKLTDTMGAFFLALDGDDVIGSVMTGYDGHRGSISYLGVDPDRQTVGIGRKLMDRSEEFLTELGCPKINLLVRTGNEPVLAFYKKLGYACDPTVQMGKRLIPDD